MNIGKDAAKNRLAAELIDEVRMEIAIERLRKLRDERPEEFEKLVQWIDSLPEPENDDDNRDAD